MDLSKEEVEEFKMITLEVYSKELTYEEAENQGSRLIQLFELMLKSKSPLVKGREEMIQND